MKIYQFLLGLVFGLLVIAVGLQYRLISKQYELIKTQDILIDLQNSKTLELENQLKTWSDAPSNAKM